MLIYWNKRKHLHEKRVQLPKDFLGTPTWPPFHCFGTPKWPPWRHVKTLYKDDTVVDAVAPIMKTPDQQKLHNEDSKGVFLSVNPKTDFRSKNGFRVPFGKSKSGFLIWWILFEKGFTGFEIRRIQIQINGLVIYAVPFTVDPKLVRWSSGISSWSIPIEAVEFPRCCHLPQNIWKH